MHVTTTPKLRSSSDVPHRSVLAFTNRLPLAIGLVFTVFCVFLSRTLNIWQDEAYSLHSSANGVVDAWRQGIVFEAQAPLYFALLALWRALNASATHARLLSLAFSLVTLYLTWDFSRRYLRVPPWIVLAAVAFNPFTVWAAVEIRPYAASITFSAALLLLFFRGFIDKMPSNRARIAFVAVAIAGTYTQYYVASLVLACGVALVALGRWNGLRTYAIGSLVFGVALVPLANFLPLQFHAYDAFAAAFKLPGYVMATVLASYPFPHDWIGTWVGSRAQNAGYFAAVAVPVSLIAISLRTLHATTKALLAVVVALFGFYTAVIAIAHVHVLIPRHSLVILVPLVLLLFGMIGDCPRIRRRPALAAYLAVFSVFSMLTYWHTYRTLSKTGDWRRVATYVETEVEPRDAVILFNAEAELPFRYYFRDPNVVVAIPRPMSFEKFDEEAFVLHSEQDVASSLGTVAAGHRHIWLVQSNVCARQGVFFGCKYLNSYIAAHFHVVRFKAFDGSTVTELARPLTASLKKTSG